MSTAKKHTRREQGATPLAPTAAELRERVLKRLSSMSKDELAQSLIDAGILTKTSSVAKVYREAPVLSYREPLTKPG